MVGRLLAALALVVTLGLAACGSDDDADTTVPNTTAPDTTLTPGPTPTPIPVAEAVGLTTDEPVFVEGFLHEDNGVTRLCEAILESYPPQCGGAALLVEGLDWSTVADAQEAPGGAGGVRWKEGAVLEGTLADDRLIVS